jgi:hypothetical protein
MKKIYLPIALGLLALILLLGYLSIHNKYLTLGTKFNSKVTLRGEPTCLLTQPGINDYACYSGLKDEQGNYYELRTTDTMYSKYKHIEVQGIFREVSPEFKKLYKVKGTIEVQSIKEYNNGN